MRIVLTGGGTGGHLFPLLAVAKKLKEKLGGEVEFLYIGSGAEIEREIIEKEGIRGKYIMAGKVRRYFSWRNFTDALKAPIGFIQALWILLCYMPDVVFSKGGYVSAPVIIASWLYRIPVLIHDSDALPGAANQFLARFSNRVAVSYPGAEKYFPSKKTSLIGNPVREELLNGDAAAARKFFNFTESKPIILVIGGSQGSQIINEAIIRILPKMLMRAQVIHQTGANNYNKVVHEAGEFGIKAGREGYYPIKFLDADIQRDAYAAADLVISRAGANSIADIASNLKPAILIPLEKAANDHQRMNAYEIAKIGGATVLEETNLGENMLLKKIEEILDNEDLRKNMVEKFKAFYHPQASEHLAEGLIELANS
jgi:UDP-N-acetylglucosamine--N-acetylmuramyl-(pentapeptide) pyrophosphoryl-undecaprenol N-acetylglucosamine transferase